MEQKKPGRIRLGRDFAMVLIGQIISMFGSAVIRFALPVYILELTDSSGVFGVVSSLSVIPTIVFSLIGGVLADRVNKRNIMVGLDFFTALLIFVLSLVFHIAPQVPLICITLMALSGIAATYEPAVLASIPLLVGEDGIMTGNALVNQVHMLASILGPAIGGILYAALGIRSLLWIGGGCFFASAVMEIFIRIPFTRRKAGKSVFHIVRDDMHESLHYMLHEQRILFQGSALLALFNLFLASLIVISLPVIVTQNWGLDESKLGYVQAVLAFGGITGGVISTFFGRHFSIRKSHLLLAVCSCFVALEGAALLLPLSVSTEYAILMVMCFLAMLFATMFNIEMMSFAQSITDKNLLGKVMATVSALVSCMSPLGQLMYGFIFQITPRLHGAVFLAVAGIAWLLCAFARRFLSGVKDEELAKKDATYAVK